MATFKNLVSRVRVLDGDERGAAGSVEIIGAVAVAVLILAAVLKMMGDGESEGIVKTVKQNLTNLIGKVGK
jgi:hypothetical protein